MLEIELSKKEYDYIRQSPFLISGYEEIISSVKQLQDKFLLEISEDQADEMRDLCSEHLLLVGFDENYNPNFEGRILESLIDKFFVG